MFDFNSDVMNSLSRHGAFLTSGSTPNPMTISWGYIGQMWGKPVFVAPVRITRFTKGLIDESGVFTVSVPREGEYLKELAYCGSHSGRDVNKVEECGMKMVKASEVDTSYVADCQKAYECRIITTLAFSEESIPEEIASMYKLRDYHVLYFAEILATHG